MIDAWRRSSPSPHARELPNGLGCPGMVGTGGGLFLSAKASVIRFRGSLPQFHRPPPLPFPATPPASFPDTHGPMLESRGRGGREAETPAINLTPEARQDAAWQWRRQTPSWADPMG